MPITANPKLTSLSHADLLARVPLFSSLSQSQRRALANSTYKLRFKRGEPLVKAGEDSKAIFILMIGRASVVARDSQGKEVILATLKQGDYLGEMNVLDGLPHSADVVADVQTDVLVLARSEFLQCLKENHDAALSMMRELVGRLRRADEKIESLALMDVYGRVARALLDMATLGPDGHYQIKTKVSKQTMAKTIGASREMVSKVFKNLEQSGVISLRADGSMAILNRGSELFQ